jgi:hypothetical protein
MVGLLERSRYQRTLCGVVAIAGLLWLLGDSANGATTTITAGKPLAQLRNAAQKLTAYDGYVVFSQYEPSARDWHLMVWHDGSIRALPVPVRGMPFDVDAGPAANGQPAIVYSRCSQDPPPPTANELQSSEYVREPDWTDARGCRIYELALPNGSPKLVKGIYAPGASDSTPAIWDGDIAFARLTAGSRDAKVYFWRHSTRRLAALGAGPGPCRAAVVQAPCEAHPRTPPSAWVGGMSLDGSALGYEWIVEDGGVGFGEGADPEIRVDPLQAGHQSAPSQVTATSFVSGTCGYAESNSPSVAGSNLFFDTNGGGCEGGPEEILSSFTSYSATTRMWRAARFSPGLVVAIAEDHGTTYWIRHDLKVFGPNDECSPGLSACSGEAFTEAQDCSPAHGTCTLMQTNDLTLGAPQHRSPGIFG